MKGHKDSTGQFHPHNSNMSAVHASEVQQDKIKTKPMKQQMNMKQFINSGDYLVDEIKERNRRANKHFFDADSMRFFSSRVSELAWVKGDRKNYQTNPIYFITSEQDKGSIKHAGSTRAFTVRRSNADGNIDTIGEFQGHATLNDARKTIKEIIHS